MRQISVLENAIMFTEKRGEALDTVIYADILFLIDISMDFFALFLTSYIIKARFYSSRAVIASVLGAIYSVISVIMRITSIPLSGAVSVLMCLVAFKGIGIRLRALSVIIFYAVNMLSGGAMTAIFNAFNKLSGGSKDVLIYGELNTVSDNMPFALFVISLAALAILAKILINLLSRRPSNTPISVDLIINGLSGTVHLLEDSGNMLIEPLSGEAIIFLKRSKTRELFGESLVNALSMKSELYQIVEKQRFRTVFFNTVSGSDMRICVRPEKISIGKEPIKAWVTISDSFNTDGFDGIIPSRLVR